MRTTGVLLILMIGCLSVHVKATQPCPQWLESYADWHSKTLHTLGESQHRKIVYVCNSLCGGLGDRIRGLFFTLRIAAATNRLFFVEWSSPLKLSAVLAPSIINWTVPGELFNASRNTLTYMDPMISEDRRASFDMQIKIDFSAALNVWLQTNELPDVHLSTLIDTPLSAEHMNCIWTYLFSETVELTDLIRLEQRKLGIVRNEYVAGHLRLGGSEGEEESVNRLPFSIEAALSILRRCNEILGPKSSKAVVPLLLITDNVYLRDVFARRAPNISSLFVVPTTSPIHYDRASSTSRHIDTFIELGLLAQSKYLLLSPSGFSNVAMWLGQHVLEKTAYELKLCHAPVLKPLTRRSDTCPCAWSKSLLERAQNV